MNTKIKNISAWVIASALTALLLFSAAGKLFLQPEQMDYLKLTDWRIIIAIGEIGSALLFLFPRTNFFGSILLSSYMGGAIIIHMTTGTSIAMASTVLILVWIVLYLRNSEFFKLQ